MERDFYDTAVNNFLNAVIKNEINVVEEILSQNQFDIMVVNGDQNNALILASLNGHLDMLEFLINKIAEENRKKCIDMKNELGISSMIAACASGNPHLLYFLFKASVGPNGGEIELPETDLGNTCFGIACANGNLEIVKFLVYGGAEFESVEGSLCPHPLMLAMINGHEHILNFFYLPSTSKLRSFPLCLKCIILDLEAVILEKIPYIDIDECCPEFHNFNILSLAIILQNREMFNLLMSFGANLDVKLFDGNTIHIFAQKVGFCVSPNFAEI